MELFVIGDVHGCYYTLLDLIQQHWNPEKEILIQVGDLVDRGLHSGKVVKHMMKLQEDYPGKVVVLMGNHEHECIFHYEERYNHNWFIQGGEQTVKDFEATKINLKKVIPWMKQLPLKWENDFVFCSHAGISDSAEDPYQIRHLESIVWTRSHLKNLGKMQIVGHTPLRNGEPFYLAHNNVWYIDTGAFLRLFLTGLKISATGEVTSIAKVATDRRDLP